ELGGQSGKLNYYSFWNYRTGSGFRDHTDFYANTNYVRLGYEFSNRFRIAADYTHMSYLAQQAGGLTDVQYTEDPYQSLRSRNWFRVKWNLTSVNVDYDITDQTRVNSRFFGLAGTRQAVGNLQTPNRPDLEPYNNRDLLVDYYSNIGNETRLLHSYRIRKQPSALLVGMRFYRGSTEKTQGYGSDGSDADFRFYTEDLKLKSDYNFPSYNLSAFSENVFNITDRLSITPGIRLDRIVTTAEGYYDSSIRIPLTGEVVVDSSTFEKRERTRNLLLAGIGISYKFNDKTELYSNFSQNYRAITFNDIRVVNPSSAVDPQLQDEKGFNLDLGIRGNMVPWLTSDIGLFWLSYRDRIGSYLRVVEDEFFGQRLVRYTTNIADADILGLESYLEADLNALFKSKSAWKWSVFTNLAYTYARYYNAAESAIEGNRVEYVPEWNFKTGLQSQWKKLGMSLQFAYISQQFSEATNAGADGNQGSATGIFGIIPEYAVLDFSVDYAFKGFQVEGGINNITDAVYFTRRATGYPGPGIITASPRNFYLGLGYSF
ncbi:MAG: TonB-dependent receptor family protein, partial [Owenweeksia sp.]